MNSDRPFSSVPWVHTYKAQQSSTETDNEHNDFASPDVGSSQETHTIPSPATGKSNDASHTKGALTLLQAIRQGETPVIQVLLRLGASPALVCQTEHTSFEAVLHSDGVLLDSVPQQMTQSEVHNLGGVPTDRVALSDLWKRLELHSSLVMWVQRHRGTDHCLTLHELMPRDGDNMDVPVPPHSIGCGFIAPPPTGEFVQDSDLVTTHTYDSIPPPSPDSTAEDSVSFLLADVLMLYWKFPPFSRLRCCANASNAILALYGTLPVSHVGLDSGQENSTAILIEAAEDYPKRCPVVYLDQVVLEPNFLSSLADWSPQTSTLVGLVSEIATGLRDEWSQRLVQIGANVPSCQASHPSICQNPSEKNSVAKKSSVISGVSEKLSVPISDLPEHMANENSVCLSGSAPDFDGVRDGGDNDHDVAGLIAKADGVTLNEAANGPQVDERAANNETNCPATNEPRLSSTNRAEEYDGVLDEPIKGMADLRIIEAKASSDGNAPRPQSFLSEQQRENEACAVYLNPNVSLRQKVKGLQHRLVAPLTSVMVPFCLFMCYLSVGRLSEAEKLITFMMQYTEQRMNQNQKRDLVLAKVKLMFIKGCPVDAIIEHLSGIFNQFLDDPIFQIAVASFSMMLADIKSSQSIFASCRKRFLPDSDRRPLLAQGPVADAFVCFAGYSMSILPIDQACAIIYPWQPSDVLQTLELLIKEEKSDAESDVEFAVWLREIYVRAHLRMLEQTFTISSDLTQHIATILLTCLRILTEAVRIIHRFHLFHCLPGVFLTIKMLSTLTDEPMDLEHPLKDAIEKLQTSDETPARGLRSPVVWKIPRKIPAVLGKSVSGIQKLLGDANWRGKWKEVNDLLIMIFESIGQPTPGTQAPCQPVRTTNDDSGLGFLSSLFLIWQDHVLPTSLLPLLPDTLSDCASDLQQSLNLISTYHAPPLPSLAASPLHSLPLPVRERVRGALWFQTVMSGTTFVRTNGSLTLQQVFDHVNAEMIAEVRALGPEFTYEAFVAKLMDTELLCLSEEREAMNWVP